MRKQIDSGLDSLLPFSGTWRPLLGGHCEEIKYMGVVQTVFFCLTFLQMNLPAYDYLGVWLFYPLADCPPDG